MIRLIGSIVSYISISIMCNQQHETFKIQQQSIPLPTCEGDVRSLTIIVYALQLLSLIKANILKINWSPNPPISFN